MSRPVAIRLAFAGGLALVMAVLIVVLLSVSGSKSTSASPPDPECLANWNNDVAAVYVGKGRVWRAVSSLPAGTPERRAALQREASEKANATISADGKLAPL